MNSITCSKCGKSKEPENFKPKKEPKPKCYSCLEKKQPTEPVDRKAFLEEEISKLKGKLRPLEEELNSLSKPSNEDNN